MRKDYIKKIFAGVALISICACYTMPVLAYSNEEAVYSKIDNSGKVYKTIVSTVDGEETNKQEVSKELPIECEVKYKLDDTEISAEEISGKSGKVTITLKYTNKDEKDVIVDGKKEKMYTPFLIVSGVVIDDAKNKNIVVNHGKVINNGEHTVVAGFAVPGLKESLNVEHGCDDYDTIEITMDTTCFELKNIMTYASPKVFSNMNFNFGEFNKVFDKVQELQDGSKQIENGAVKLNDGIISFNTGVKELKNGSIVLRDGVYSLNEGAEKLNAGALALRQGIGEYNGKAKEFNGAVSQVSSGASELNTKYDEINNGILGLNSKSSELEAGAKKLNDGSAELKGGVDMLSKKVSGAASGVATLQAGVTEVKKSTGDIVSALNGATGTLSSADEKAKKADEDITSLISTLQ